MASSEYLSRTKANVFDSDATLVFTYGPPTGDSLKTITYAHHLKKPYHEVDLVRTKPKPAVIEIMRWLAGDEELNDYDEYVAYPPPLQCVLNVAGSRESQASGIQEAVFHLIGGCAEEGEYHLYILPSVKENQRRSEVDLEIRSVR